MARPAFQLSKDQAQVLMYRLPAIQRSHPQARASSHRLFVREFIRVVFEITDQIYSPAIYKRLLELYGSDRSPSTDTLASEIKAFEYAIKQERHAARPLSAIGQKRLLAQRDYLQRKLSRAEQEVIAMRAKLSQVLSELRVTQTERDSLQHQVEAMRLIAEQNLQLSQQLSAELDKVRNACLNCADAIADDCPGRQNADIPLTAQLQRAKQQLELRIANDWQAVEVWLTFIRAQGCSMETEKTYRYHLAKLRWYCEHVVHTPPSLWSAREVKNFVEFLQALPATALCACSPAGEPGCASYAKEGEAGWTPFRVQPSTSSRSDIMRFVHAMFNAWHQIGYISIHPMALTQIGRIHKPRADRTTSLDLYELVLAQIANEKTASYYDRQIQARDLFIFEALRGLKLSASEIVKAKMSAFSQLIAPGKHKRILNFQVTEESSKTKDARTIPVTPAVWQRFVTYRNTFGLPSVPAFDETTSLLLSPKTRALPAKAQGMEDSPEDLYCKFLIEVGSRKGLYKIVKTRLKQTARSLRDKGESAAAESLEQSSTRWLGKIFEIVKKPDSD